MRRTYHALVSIVVCCVLNGAMIESHIAGAEPGALTCDVARPERLIHEHFGNQLREATAQDRLVIASVEKRVPFTLVNRDRKWADEIDWLLVTRPSEGRYSITLMCFAESPERAVAITRDLCQLTDAVPDKFNEWLEMKKFEDALEMTCLMNTSIEGKSIAIEVSPSRRKVCPWRVRYSMTFVEP